MATQKRVSRGSAKKSSAAKAPAKATASRRSAAAKAGPSRAKRSVAAKKAPSERRGGVIKRAIRKGISELAKVGS